MVSGETLPQPTEQEHLNEMVARVRNIIAPREQISGSTSLQTNDIKEYSVAQIKTMTPISVNTDQGRVETTLPDFLRKNLHQVAGAILTPDEFTNMHVSETMTQEARLNLIDTLITKAISPEAVAALKSLGVSAQTSADQDLFVAALQAAAIEDVQEYARSIKPPSKIDEDSVVADERRRQLYTRMTRIDDEIHLRGEDMQAVEKVLHLGSKDKPVDVTVPILNLILIKGMEGSASPREKQIAQQAVRMLGQKFGSIEAVNKFTDTYQKALENKPLTNEEVQYLQDNLHDIQGSSNFIADIHQAEIKRSNSEYNDDKYISHETATTVREDLMAAQQIINTLVPPQYIKQVVELEEKLDATEKGPEKDQLSHDLVKLRQKLYRSALTAYRVTGERDEAIEPTEEEKKIADEIQFYAAEESDFVNFQGKEEHSSRNTLNAVDANRIATRDLLKEFGVSDEVIEKLRDLRTWNSMQTQRQVIQDAKDGRKWADEVLKELGVPADAANYNLIRHIISDRLNTDLRLAGFENTENQQKIISRFQTLTGGDLPQNLVLPVFRMMGLKGIQFLYRRSLTKSKETPDLQLPPDIAEAKIKLATKIEKNSQASKVKADDVGDVLLRLAALSGVPVDTSPVPPPPAPPHLPDSPNLPSSPDAPAEDEPEPEITVKIDVKTLLLSNTQTAQMSDNVVPDKNFKPLQDEAKTITEEEVLYALSAHPIDSFFINHNSWHYGAREGSKIQNERSAAVRRGIRDLRNSLGEDIIASYFVENPQTSEERQRHMDILKIDNYILDPRNARDKYNTTPEIQQLLRDRIAALNPQAVQQHLNEKPFDALEYVSGYYTSEPPLNLALTHDEIAQIIIERLKWISDNPQRLKEYLEANPAAYLRINSGLLKRPELLSAECHKVIEDFGKRLRFEVSYTAYPEVHGVGKDVTHEDDQALMDLIDKLAKKSDPEVEAELKNTLYELLKSGKIPLTAIIKPQLLRAFNKRLDDEGTLTERLKNGNSY